MACAMTKSGIRRHMSLLRSSANFFRLDLKAGDEASNVSAQGTRCTTGCLRRGSQLRAVGSQWPRGGSPRPTCATGSESKLGFLGIVGHAWARAGAPDCVENTDTSRLDRWIIGLFRQREGVACVAATSPQRKVEKSGIVWHGLVPSRHQPSNDKLDTIPLKSLKVWQFPGREGGWGVHVRRASLFNASAARTLSMLWGGAICAS